MQRVGILTVSDRCSQGTQEDKSGDQLEAMIGSSFPDATIQREVVADEVEDIQRVLRAWSDDDTTFCQLIITTGGTGFAPRDVTPEATKPLLHKECPGLVVAMLQQSLQITPMAMLSRPAAGIRHHSLIVNLPGSAKGSTENLAAIVPALPHAIALINQTTNKDQHHPK